MRKEFPAALSFILVLLSLVTPAFGDQNPADPLAAALDQARAAISSARNTTREEINRRLSCAAGAAKWGLLPGASEPSSMAATLRDAFDSRLGTTHNLGEQAEALFWDPILLPILRPDMSGEQFLRIYTADVVGNEAQYKLKVLRLKTRILGICTTGGKVLLTSKKRQDEVAAVYNKLVEEGGSDAAAK